MSRRLVIEMIGGALAVHDRERPGAAMVTLDLEDGRRIALARHLCGWLPDADADPVWPDQAAARAAFADEGDGWAAVLAAGAALAPPPSGDLGITAAARIAELAARHPGAWIDGPHPRPDGTWNLVVGGPGVPRAVWGVGPAPDAAALDLVAR
ncbi:MAG: hypothetical protein RJQ03_05470, partial [Miltoncostaeaceae bacterium]